MDIILMLKAVILGIVEGLTEFLPVSSTGHLIIVGDLLNFNDDKGKVFEVVIQLAAILAVCWEFRAKIATVIAGLPSQPHARKFALNLLLAFLPAAILGFLLVKNIKLYLFNPLSVSLAFIVGGLIILLVERANKPAKVLSVEQMSWKDALTVGLTQCLALIPGTSRSGATIIGGMWFGLSRRTATEFSFFLAIPTMFAATIYDVYKHWALFSRDDIGLFAVGSVASFAAAFLAIRALLRFITTHTFNGFAWYRIAFGLFILLSWNQGWIDWSAA